MTEEASARWANEFLEGRPLREWHPEQTGTSLDEMFAWKYALRNDPRFGKASISDIMGPAFDEAFTRRYHCLVKVEQEKEQAAALDAVFLEGATFLGLRSPTVVHRFLIPHGSWVPDHQYAVVDCDAGRLVIGRLKGAWKVFDIEHVKAGLERMTKVMEGLATAAKLLSGPPKDA
jgi:hypothetical protein